MRFTLIETAGLFGVRVGIATRRLADFRPVYALRWLFLLTSGSMPYRVAYAIHRYLGLAHPFALAITRTPRQGWV